MAEKVHGELYNHNRWCEVCDHYHGPWYRCEHYPQEVLDELTGEIRQWKSNLQDPKWAQEQLEKGVPPMVLGIFRALAEGEPE